jgi:uncharacterized protein (DUF1015 family)
VGRAGVTALVRPFAALRPNAATASAVIAPPYDVVDTEEARSLVAGRPHSFLHVSRPEIGFPPGIDAHEERIYARGAINLAALVDRGLLERESAPCYYAYRMTMGSHTQTGLALTASVRAYDENRIRKHELTRPDKEDDRVRNITALNAQTGPVLCAHRASETVTALLGEAVRSKPLIETEGPNAVVHTIWPIADPAAIATVTAAMDSLGVLYIADGHHRSAAASRVAAARRGSGRDAHGSHEYFLCVAFGSDEMRILDYNRVVADLNGMRPAEFLERIERDFHTTPATGHAKPDAPRTFGLYLDGQWYRLHAADNSGSDPVERLDVSVLQRRVIEPLLGIRDPRTDARLGFVGGIRGFAALERRVDSGEAAAAFALYPTSMEQLMAVADAQKLMPPKSTWFEPKLADGLLSHVLD